MGACTGRSRAEQKRGSGLALVLDALRSRSLQLTKYSRGEANMLCPQTLIERAKPIFEKMGARPWLDRMASQAEVLGAHR